MNIHRMHEYFSRRSFACLILCILTFWNQPIQSQVDVNSLNHLIAQNPEPDSLVLLYKEISIQYVSINLDSSIYYGKLGLDLAEELGNDKLVADFNNNLGIFYRKRGAFEIALDYYFRSLSIKEELLDSKGIASTKNNIGVVYADLNEADSALKYYLQCLPYYNSVNDTSNFTKLQINIGNTYLLKEENNTALDWYLKVKPIIEFRNDSSNMHLVYLNIGECYQEMEIPDSARKYLSNAINIGLALSNDDMNAQSFRFMGRFLLSANEFEKAYFYLSNSYRLTEKRKDIYALSELTNLLSQYFEQNKLFDSALYYLKEHLVLKDSLNLEDINRNLGRLEAEYSYQKAEFAYQNEIRENEVKISRQRLFRNFLILFTFLVLLLVVYGYRSYRNKQKANKLLAEMDGLKSRLFSNISHEFRTPLTLILGPLEDMLAEETSKKPTQKTVQMMQRNANRLLELVNQMLDLSKVEAGSMKLELEESDILKFFRVLLSSFNSLAEKKEILFKQSIPAGTLLSWFDEDKIEKILTNLLSNAFKFTPEGGTVACEVTPSKDKRSIKIKVSDTGKGIAPDQQEKIFDRFHQVETSGEPESIGTGIGLALTKELVVLMHGELSVKSKVGEGTSFTVTLPLGKSHLDEDEYTIVDTRETKEVKKTEILTESTDLPSEESLEEEAMEESKLPLVLTVEDNEDIRTHIREHLEDYCRVMEAGNGEIGLDKAIENIPDLVITDLMMPKMNGVEMCKKLKTDERTSHIPVIMLTAKADVDDRIEGLETGADAYVTKPFSIKELRVRVNKLIEQRQKLRERFSRNVKLEPRDIAITSADETFLNRAMEIIETHMGNSEFGMRDFQDEMGMSRMQLFRKIKALTDHSPSEFIRNLRLKRAAKLMEQNYGNIAQITYKVGFNNLSYFAKCFKELFEISPSEYLKKHSQ